MSTTLSKQTSKLIFQIYFNLKMVVWKKESLCRNLTNFSRFTRVLFQAGIFQQVWLNPYQGWIQSCTCMGNVFTHVNGFPETSKMICQTVISPLILLSAFMVFHWVPCILPLLLLWYVPVALFDSVGNYWGKKIRRGTQGEGKLESMRLGSCNRGILSRDILKLRGENSESRE